MLSKTKGAHLDKASIHVASTSTKGIPKLIDIQDIAERLKFAPEDGRIWLDDERMILFHASVFSSLRREIIDTLGPEKARALFMRIGYSAGSRDATLAISIRGSSDPSDVFAVGPQLHALEGFVAVEPVRIDIDVERGVHYVEQIWHDSAEALAHIEAVGFSSEAVCWMQVGYASGFNSALFGRPILFKEIECSGTGAAHCRIIGKPLEEWSDSEADLQFLQPEEFINTTLVRRTISFRGPDGESIPISDSDFMVGTSSGFLSACNKLQQVASTNASVLLLGETGVGKERFANILHRLSKRANGPFIALNCAAIPENLLEAELFGVERGAYTGAGETRKGRFERADTGTLFLDEIGTLNEAAQAKLLRALQEREIERVGGSSTREVDVRIVAATNADLMSAVREGRFRSDLFYRLNVFPIQIPPLRQRRDDIALLIHHFVGKYSVAHGKSVTGFTHRAIAALLAYDYPGNVRELENIIERGIILATNEKPIDYDHLFQSESQPAESLLAMDRGGSMRPANKSILHSLQDESAIEDIAERVLDAALSLEVIELATMREAVRRADGNLSQAARILGISRAQLAYRLDKNSDILK